MNSLSLVSAAPALGGKCRACEAIGASLRTQVKIVFWFPHTYFLFYCFCSLLPLPTAGAATLAKAKRLTHFYSVAPLLEKWFACFPSSVDSLKLACFPLVSINRETLLV